MIVRGTAAQRDFRFCGCHPQAKGHRFGKDLVCCCAGCEVNWHQHQNNAQSCQGGKVPASIMVNRDAA